FVQAEDGIRDWSVTGVQTCALPIWCAASWLLRLSRWITAATSGWLPRGNRATSRATEVETSPARTSWATASERRSASDRRRQTQIGRASCREREENAGGAAAVEKQS